MKKQHENLISVLLKSFFREIKPFPLIFIIAIISLFFIGGYNGYRSYTSEKNLQNAQELYGDYTLSVNYLNFDEVDKIKTLCADYETVTVYQKGINTSNGLMIYGTSSFFDISNLELLQGQLPQNKKEVLCEQKYLIQQGITFSESQDSYIELDGVNYLITGTMRVNDNIHIEGYYMPRFFLDYASNSFEKILYNYSLYIVTPTQKGAYELKNHIVKECGIEESNITFNNSVLIYTGTTESGESSDIILSICDKLFYLIFVLLAIVFTSVVSMRYKKMKSTINIYNKLGISKQTLLSVASLFMFGFFFITLLFSVVIFILLVFLLNANYTIIVKPIIFMTLFATLNILLSIFSFSNNLKNKFFIRNHIPSIKRTKNSEKYNSELINTKCPFFRIAQINISYTKKRYVLSIIGTVVTIVILSLFLYSTNYINIDQGEYKYDYRVDYVYDSMADSYTGSKEIYDKYTEIIASELFDVYSIYYKNHTVKIDKKSMDKDYIHFLRNSNTEAFMELEHIDNKPFSTRFIVIGADEEQQKNVYGLTEQHSLKDNECLLVNYVNTPNGKGFATGFSKGEALTVSHYDYSTVEGGVEADFKLTIKDTIEDIDFNIQDSFYYPIIIVNKTVFNKISPFEYDYPQLLYLNSKTTYETEINDFFKGTSGMLLTDLTEIKSMMTEQTITSAVSIFVMCLLLVFILATNSSLNIINKYNYERKQLATLKAIGIDNKYLIFNLAYEYIITIVHSIIFGSIFSFLTCYIMYFYIREKVFYFVFEIPILYVGIPLLTVFLIYILVAIPIYQKIRKMDIAETLQTE